jgi:hypothetical protein
VQRDRVLQARQTNYGDSRGRRGVWLVALSLTPAWRTAKMSASASVGTPAVAGKPRIATVPFPRASLRPSCTLRRSSEFGRAAPCRAASARI